MFDQHRLVLSVLFVACHGRRDHSDIIHSVPLLVRPHTPACEEQGCHSVGDNASEVSIASSAGHSLTRSAGRPTQVQHSNGSYTVWHHDLKVESQALALIGVSGTQKSVLSHAVVLVETGMSALKRGLESERSLNLVVNTSKIFLYSLLATASILIVLAICRCIADRRGSAHTSSQQPQEHESVSQREASRSEVLAKVPVDRETMPPEKEDEETVCAEVTDSDEDSYPHEGTSSQVFAIQPLQGECQFFKWVSHAEAASLGIDTDGSNADVSDRARDFVSEGGSADLIAPPWSGSALKRILKDSSVSCEKWPFLKLQTLVMELKDNHACLVRTTQGLLKRIMERVLVIVFHPESGKVIMPDSKAIAVQLMKKGATDISAQEHTLAHSRVPNERIEQTVQRLVKEKLGLSEDAIEIIPDIKTTESEEISEFLYPGLTTIICRHLVAVKIVKGQLDGSTPVQVKSGSDSIQWQWQSSEAVPLLRQHLTWFQNCIGKKRRKGRRAKHGEAEDPDSTRYENAEPHNSGAGHSLGCGDALG